MVEPGAPPDVGERSVEPAVDEMLVRDVSRVVVARFAPEELPAFRVVSNAYFGGEDDNRSPDLGPGETVALLTPVVLAAMNEVTQHLIGEFVRKTVTQGGKTAARAVRRLFGVKYVGTSDTPIDLTDDEWAEVRHIVTETAKRHGLPPEAADRLADAVVDAGQGDDGME